MAVQLWKDGKDGKPEMVIVDAESFNMSFLEHGYRFTEQPEPEKEEEDKKLETNEDTEEKPDGAEERKADADKPGEEPVIKEEVLKRSYNKRR